MIYMRKLVMGLTAIQVKTVYNEGFGVRYGPQTGPP